MAEVDISNAVAPTLGAGGTAGLTEQTANEGDAMKGNCGFSNRTQNIVHVGLSTAESLMTVEIRQCFRHRVQLQRNPVLEMIGVENVVIGFRTKSTCATQALSAKLPLIGFAPIKQ